MNNEVKRNSYTWAFERIPMAINEGFFLEAITLEESIIADRLLSFQVLFGSKVGDKNNFGSLIKVFTEISEKNPDLGVTDLALGIDAWRKKRNDCIHAAVKSLPGVPTIDVESYQLKAEETAFEGFKLARKVSDWQKGQKDKRKREFSKIKKEG